MSLSVLVPCRGWERERGRGGRLGHSPARRQPREVSRAVGRSRHQRRSASAVLLLAALCVKSA